MRILPLYSFLSVEQMITNVLDSGHQNTFYSHELHCFREMDEKLLLHCFIIWHLPPNTEHMNARQQNFQKCAYKSSLIKYKSWLMKFKSWIFFDHVNKSWNFGFNELQIQIPNIIYRTSTIHHWKLLSNIYCLLWWNKRFIRSIRWLFMGPINFKCDREQPICFIFRLPGPKVPTRHEHLFYMNEFTNFSRKLK